jgi:hypothetical protein
MADFVVNYEMLHGIQETMGRLKSEFENIDAVKNAANWGDGGISSAMGSFASNWKIHREKVLGSMEAMGKSAAECASQTSCFDTKMQQTLTK